MWMNEGEIEQMLEFTRYEAPEFAPYARYLSDWMDVVNDNSDGWAYWKAGSGAAGKLMDALQALRDLATLRRRGAGRGRFQEVAGPDQVLRYEAWTDGADARRRAA
ncbi:hypothetical protein [Rhizobium leguminosarum]|uniref:hypothetical protein n=1 Tax=Rhizobium leguminosarum TaxID=384 RepID=UPI002E11569E|nr:hypothetical protein U8Q02_37550 [Rhizobium leguminosarum]